MNEFGHSTIKQIEVTHKKNFSGFSEYASRNARIVVWAITNENQKVWLSTIEGGLDAICPKIKEAMFQEFFHEIINHEIVFSEKNGFLFAEKNSLPPKFNLGYKEIKDLMWPWIQESYSEELAKIKTDRHIKASTTKKLNLLERERKLAKKVKGELLISFERNRNPRRGNQQWAGRAGGKIFILDRLEHYDPAEKEVPVEKIRDLTAGKIILVRRIR